VSRGFVAEWGLPVPDRVPDALLTRYGDEARRKVQYRRSRRYAILRFLRLAPVGRRHRLATDPRSRLFGDRELWTNALTVFGCAVIAVAGVGALVYAILLVPPAGVGMVTTLVLLLGFSSWAAVRLHEREVERLARLAG
jgi:hypothetical protein